MEVEVVDTGVGMPAEVRCRALEPLYTTKPIGEGTGLGLSVCANIVESLGGRLTLESQPGKGTTVRLTFPESRLCPFEPDAVAIAQPSSSPVESPVESPLESPVEPAAVTPAAAPAKKRILVIDDDRSVANVVSRMLREHDVRVAHSGPDGVALLERMGEVDVILCDLMMPGWSGVDVYEHIADRYPGIERRIVFLTGGVFDPRAEALLEQPDVECLDKPMSADDLRRAVEKVCARHPER
jgi:CheY-like chemotaxis protein